jgi:DNA-binding NtrC family response regulator
MRPSLRVLVVDDEPIIRRVLRSIIEGAGHAVLDADGVRSALRTLRSSTVDVALVDHHLNDGDASVLLRALPGIAPALPVVVLTGDASIDLAVSSLKGGACDFVLKPPDPKRLVRVLESAAGSRVPLGGLLDPFIGTSAAVRELEKESTRAIEGASPILLEGETGSGKSTLARWIHARSSRRTRPFLDLSAADAALEAELFGVERGPGGERARPGLIERASGGSIFVDEIAELEPRTQARLAKLIEEGRVRRSGGLADVRVDVRLFAATRMDLARLVAEGRFRADLFYRIGAAPIRVPPLRARIGDLPDLVGSALESLGAARTRGIAIAPGAIEALQAHAWPGNLRELRQVLERAVLAAAGPAIQPSELGFTRSPAGGVDAPGGTLADVERAHIVRMLETTDFNVGEAARRLGVPRSTLYERLKEYGIERARSRRDG